MPPEWLPGLEPLHARILHHTPTALAPADFALILPNDSYIKDLGALLPAVGAVAEAVGAASSGRMSGVQASCCAAGAKVHCTACSAL